MDQNPQVDQGATTPKIKNSSLSKIWLIILVVLALGLACFSGYIFMQYRDSNTRVNELEGQLTDVKKQLDEIKSNDTSKESNGAANGSGASTNNNGTDSANVFTIDEWGIKFTVPKGLSKDDIIMTPAGSERWSDGTKVDVIHVATKKIHSLGGYCQQYDMFPLFRTKQKLDLENMPSAPAQIMSYASASGYYFYFSHPQALCSQSASDTTVETQQVDLINAMLESGSF